MAIFILAANIKNHKGGPVPIPRPVAMASMDLAGAAFIRSLFCQDMEVAYYNIYLTYIF